MSSAALEEEVIMIPLPPAYKFRPTDRELVKNYLLPRARGENPFPGVIAEDDTAGSTLPWELFGRHGLGDEEQAHFIVRGSDDKKPGARQDRSCAGGVGTWKKQNKDDLCFRIGDETVRCCKSNFNLHMGKGENGGSVGWVMHEYAIAAPPCPCNVRICHVAFTGHGRKRKRVPDGQETGRQQKSAHADAAAPIDGSAAPPYSGVMTDDEFLAMYNACSSFGEELPPLVDVADGDDNLQQSHLVVPDSSDPVAVGLPSSTSASADDVQEAGSQQKSAHADHNELHAMYADAMEPDGSEPPMCGGTPEELPPLVLTDGGDSFPQSHLGGVPGSSDSVGVPSATSVSANVQVPIPDIEINLEDLSQTQIFEALFGIDVSML